MERPLLKLTQEQEERASRLHREAVVVNVYGGPFSAPRALREWRAGRVRDNGQWIPPVDAAVKTHLVPDLRAGGVDCIVAAAGSLDDVALWLRELQESAPVAILAMVATDVWQAKESGLVAFVLGGSGAPAPGVEEALNVLLLYHRAGVRIWSLTHSARNLISDGCGEETNAGLSHFGRLFVQELNRQRILIDISHISDAGFWDVIEVSAAPIIATHSNCRNLCRHGRNLTDDMIRALGENGGMVALNFFPSFVRADEPTVEDLIDHVDHISALIGPERVGLGPDFCAGQWEFVLRSWWKRGSADHNARRLSLTYPVGVEDITQMPNVTRALVGRGYSDREIKGILGENFLRLFAEVIGA